MHLDDMFAPDQDHTVLKNSMFIFSKNSKLTTSNLNHPTSIRLFQMACMSPWCDCTLTQLFWQKYITTYYLLFTPWQDEKIWHMVLFIEYDVVNELWLVQFNMCLKSLFLRGIWLFYILFCVFSQNHRKIICFLLLTFWFLEDWSQVILSSTRNRTCVLSNNSF